MPGVIVGEVVDATNPLLFFAYQSGGLLADVNALFFTIMDLTAAAPTTRVAETAVNLALSPAGAKLSTGRYAPTFTPAVGPWVLGTHEIRWRYRVTSTSAFKNYRQRFELLSADEFASGAGYVGYADSAAVAADSNFVGLTITQVQRLIHSASRNAELLTARFFEPRFLKVNYSSVDSGRLSFGHPVIGLDTVKVMGAGPANATSELDRAGFRIANRHLSGLSDPDDRDDPHVAFATDTEPGRRLEQGSFPEGKQHIEVAAVFGYTDFDGTPLGARPYLLPRIIAALAVREQLDSAGLDPVLSTPSRVRSMKTRDQAITFASGSGGGGGGGGASGFGPLTGDRFVDDLLVNFMRPPHFSSVAGQARTKAT